MTSAWLLLVSFVAAQPPPSDEVEPATATVFPQFDSNQPAPRDWQLASAVNDQSGAPWGVTASWLSPQGTNGFGVMDLGISRAWNPSIGQHSVFVTPGLGTHWFDGPRTLDLSSTAYDVYLDVACRAFERERSGITLGITPGLYGDFERVDGRTFQITGRVIGDFQIDPHWTLVGGVAVVRQIRSHWLPVGGVIWMPDEDWQFDITIPRPRIARRLQQSETSDVWGYVSGQFGGGSWSLDDGTGHNVLVGYSDLRILAGLNVWHGAGSELSCELGYVFSREITVAESPEFAPSNTWVAQLVWVF